jgi:hypothetical protein
MSLTSYQAAPPRVFIYDDEDEESKLKNDSNRSHLELKDLAPAVGFEPTTNRLTADRSTTELRWIVLCSRERISCPHIPPRQAVR